jgi:hypothetical protein
MVARVRDQGRRLLMALLMLLLLVQLSGLAHVACDCPPGCPTCHHANGGVGAPSSPPLGSLVAVAPLLAPETSAPPYAASLPQGPELPSIFRPPRS